MQIFGPGGSKDSAVERITLVEQLVESSLVELQSLSNLELVMKLEMQVKVGQRQLEELKKETMYKETKLVVLAFYMESLQL